MFVLRWTITALLLAACGAALAAEGKGANTDISKFMDGRRFISRLDVDVTGDKVTDVVFVAADDKNFQAIVTVVMRLHGKTVDGKGMMEGLEGMDSLQVDLSPLGVPAVAVKNNVLIVEHVVGGSSVRTASTYRYRFNGEEGRMRLIGLDARRESSTAAVQFSWNLLNGLRIVRRGTRDGPASFQYEPEVKSTHKSTPVWMSLTPNPEDILDELVRKK